MTVSHTSTPLVAVVILNWNGQQYLSQFLPSVLNSGYGNFKVYVADNASTDNSVAFVRESFPTVSIIQNAQNSGFAQGYNEALANVEADYFVLLNSDVEVHPNWLTPAIQMLENDTTIAALQPKLIDYNNRHLFEYAGAAGGFLDKFGYPFCRGRIFNHVEEDKGQYNQASEIFWASGAALFIRKKVWHEVGGFDGDFFAHMEEIDLCWRIKNAGYKIVYCPESEVYHIGGGTLQAENPYKTYLNFRNNLAMLLKNLPSSRVFPVIFIRFWLDFFSLLKFIADGKGKHAMAISKAHRSFFMHLSANLKKRKQIKHSNSTAHLTPKSIVWEFFVKKKNTYATIIKN